MVLIAKYIELSEHVQSNCNGFRFPLECITLLNLDMQTTVLNEKLESEEIDIQRIFSNDPSKIPQLLHASISRKISKTSQLHSQCF